MPHQLRKYINIVCIRASSPTCTVIFAMPFRLSFVSHVLPTPLLIFFIAQAHAAAHVVTESDVNIILSALHPAWPPVSTPPPSHIAGLTDDHCFGSADCVPPRVCFNCAKPPCRCVKPPPHANITCSSSSDCDDGEFCHWDLLVGLTSGTCRSSRLFASRNRSFPILHQPIRDAPPLHSFGLTGDRCFFHEDCVGSRTCMSRSDSELELRNISTCEVSSSTCVCTPPSYTKCQTTSHCRQPNEFCATVLFRPSNELVSHRERTDQNVALTPICISSNLTQFENVLPVSNGSLRPQIALANIRTPSRPASGIQNAAERISEDVPPFAVPGLSVFNTFSTNDLGNEFIGGILSLIIVTQLHKIFQGLMFFTPGIHHCGYSKYIIYSRMTSFRHVSRLFAGREPFRCKAKPSCAPPTVSTLNYKLAVIPWLAFLFLIGAEVSTIMAGTDSRVESFADQNFDPVVSAAERARRPRVQDSSNRFCDDFFVATRGVFESGKVLKCVRPCRISPSRELFNCLRLQVLYGSGATVFEVYSRNGSYAGVDLSTSVLSKSGESLKTMPFRPELMSDLQRMRLLNGILNNIATRLGYEKVDIDRKLWSVQLLRGTGGRLDSMELVHRMSWSEPVQTITEAVIAGLRDLDLVLNSSGEPWVYAMPYTFERRKPLMAITKPYRLCHGWLLLTAFLVTAFHVAVNSWVTHFDDVAYVVMKELMGEDCVLGPLADSNVVCKDVDLDD
eukprot:TRINITY_DN2509_c1_g1_i1.p1 TRINITY_DN2509_c1_g1~~TRINITY_DN2509_c1_g1_i1.p1  ORF type:complete len:732 (-),score=84.26 TRINITY_DN2509_c1_g1_i1:38-2233(-)